MKRRETKPGWYDKIEFSFRTVTVKGHIYLRLEDVADYLIECGSGEDTDVRNRLMAAAKALIK